MLPPPSYAESNAMSSVCNVYNDQGAGKPGEPNLTHVNHNQQTAQPINKCIKLGLATAV